MTSDAGLLFAARALRMFAYGFLSVVLALYLSDLGLTPAQVGGLFTAALLGGAVTTGAVGTLAGRWGRRGVLRRFALLMAVSGAVYALGAPPWLLLLAALAGTISPSGYEVGPFFPLEQAALPEVSRGAPEVGLFAWYNLVGTVAVALGALAAGAVPSVLALLGVPDAGAQRGLVWAFAATGLVLAALYGRLSDRVEAPVAGGGGGGLRRSRRIVLRLTGLFGLDALAGGLVVQSLVAFWFHQRFGVDLAELGPLFFGTNLLSALSYLAAARLSRRIGLLNTMVFTHLPSNVLLALVPLMPTWPAAAGVLLLRHALSQMDVPTRQAYTLALVAPEERTAAAGITNAVRPTAASVAPLLSGLALQAAAGGLPFVLAGGLKAVYDLTLWALFRTVPLLSPGAGAPPAPIPPARP
ncbi:MAG: MFS transporter [Armatimonadota bacterium]|nr:MFS transporter [Armatimonadota bacterium]MDR7592393.1 MFS transporter [Armatimonadota bacterium]